MDCILSQERSIQKALRRRGQACFNVMKVGDSLNCSTTAVAVCPGPSAASRPSWIRCSPPVSGAVVRLLLLLHQARTRMSPIAYTHCLTPIHSHHPVFPFSLKQDQKKPSINLFPMTLYWIALPVLHLILKLASPLPLGQTKCISLRSLSFQHTVQSGLWFTCRSSLRGASPVIPNHAAHPEQKEKWPLLNWATASNCNLLPLTLKSILLGQWRETTGPKLLNDSGPWLNTSWWSLLEIFSHATKCTW